MTQEVKVPAYALGWRDWDDYELVCLSFFFWLWGQPNIGKRTEFYMHMQDMYKILHRYSAKNGVSNELEKLRRVFRIGQTNDYTLQIALLPGIEKTITPNGNMKGATVTLFDPEAIAIWYYLAGRCTGSKIIEDRAEPWRQRVASPRDIHWRGAAKLRK